MQAVRGGAVISVRKAGKVYDPEGLNVVALEDVSFEITPGQFCVVVGPSGCGKTTLLNAIAGFDRLSGGEILIDGRFDVVLSPTSAQPPLPIGDCEGLSDMGDRQGDRRRLSLRLAMERARLARRQRAGRHHRGRPTGRRAAARPGQQRASAPRPRCPARVDRTLAPATPTALHRGLAAGIGATVPAVTTGDKIPRGALAVVAVGLIAYVAAALLANENLQRRSGRARMGAGDAAARLQAGRGPGRGRQDAADRRQHPRDRDQRQRLLALPQRRGAQDRRRLAGRQRPDPMRDEGAQRAPKSAQTPGSRASYPRSSEEPDRTGQCPKTGCRSSSARTATGLADVELEGLPNEYATERGIKLEWPDYRIGVEHWRWYLPPAHPTADARPTVHHRLEDDEDPLGRDRLHR